MRVLYFGMLGDFSRIPLAHLLAAGVDVRGIVVAGQADGNVIRPLPPPQYRSDLPLLNPYYDRNIIQLGWQHEIPVWTVGNFRHPQTLATLAHTEADAAFVACFSERIPKEMLALPRHGFLNLHPSLLPAYRGPHPLFWCFRQGETKTGVTLHFMDEGFDTGDIVWQEPVTFADGLSGEAADQLCAERGGALMVKAVHQLEEAGRLPHRPQTGPGSYHPFPGAADFHVLTTWTARRAFNFMRGTAEWGWPYVIEVEDKEIMAKTAVAYRPSQQLERPVQKGGENIWIQFSPGTLQVSLS
jgi:methionyl-tRNA formyltransferase